jgi:protease secretion system outer membrane protein
MYNVQLRRGCSRAASRGFGLLAGRMKWGCLVVALLLFRQEPVSATAPLSLTEAYSFAVHHDAQVRSAEADQAIYQEEVSKANSAFFPTLRATVSKGRNQTESWTPHQQKPQYYNTVSNALSLKQPLFNLGSIAGLKQAKAVVAKSELMLAHEQSALIVRISEAFFNVLFNEENLTFTRAQTKASFEQLQQAKRRCSEGYGTVTEISEAQASHDMSIADEAAAVSGLEFSRRELERITGEYAERLCRLSPAKLALTVPEPAGVGAWLALAEENNHRLNASRQEIEVSRKEIDKNRAARYPQIDLWAGRNYSQSESNYTIGSTYDTYSVSVQVSVPIYSGGYTSASVRQAVARKIKAYDDMQVQERTVISDVRKYYDAQLNSIVQVKAYEQAVRSHEIALDGTKKAFLAGFRTNADVLDAQKKLLESRRSLAKARYQYILNNLMLKDSAGVLRPGDIEVVNSCLEPAGT